MNDIERTNKVLERLLKEKPKLQQVIADARLFSNLRDNPGWRRLFDVVAADKEKWMRRLSNRMMRNDIPSDAEIAFHRGFYEGAYFVLVHPEVAENNLAKAARIAERLAWEIEDDDTEEVYT